MVAYAHMNLPGPLNQIVVDYKKKFNDDMYTGAVYHAFSMLTEAFAKTKSTDPVKVAATLEGMKFKSFNGEVEMRKTDHQLQQASSSRSGRRRVASTRSTLKTRATRLFL